MGENFHDISFNVLGVENGVARDIAQKDANLEKWQRYGEQVFNSRRNVVYEYDDRNEPTHEAQYPYGINRPRMYSSSSDDSDRGDDQGRSQSQKNDQNQNQRRGHSHKQRSHQSPRRRFIATSIFQTHHRL